MPFSIGLIGAGWYGCHLASSLASLGFQATVFDRRSRALDEASGNNQFRLHLGFHYARHHGTRLQSRDGFQRFIERYPTLSGEVANNLYAVPKADSLIDFDTYKLIMAASGIDFVEVPDIPPFLTRVEGCIRTRERVVMLDRARDFFRRRLGNMLELNVEVERVEQGDNYASINDRRFDYVIDATWGQFSPLPITVYYEPTMLLYYETDRDMPAITMVDGPLCSVYPTEDPSIFTLSSVSHTPLGRYATAGEAHAARASVGEELVKAKRHAMEEQISRYFPSFRDVFRFAGVQLAIKTKPIGGNDDRSCYVFKNNRIFSVMSGKIDTIFFATERVLSMIEADHAIAQGPAPARALRKSILFPAA